MLGLLDPGDEVVIFEPYYENYGPDAILSRRRAALRDPARAGLVDRPGRAAERFGPADPRRSSSTRRTTRPARSSPATELELIADLCQEHDVIAFTDDIYEHLVYEGEHIPLATLPGMAERTVSIHSMSKTYSVTGWRIGWTIASPELSVGIRASTTS